MRARPFAVGTDATRRTRLLGRIPCSALPLVLTSSVGTAAIEMGAATQGWRRCPLLAAGSAKDRPANSCSTRSNSLAINGDAWVASMPAAHGLRGASTGLFLVRRPDQHHPPALRTGMNLARDTITFDT